MRALLALLLLTAPCGFPQKVGAVRAGLLYFAEHGVEVDGARLTSSDRTRLPRIQDGQVVTTPDGHAEFLMGPAAVLWMRQGSQIRFDKTEVAEPRITLLRGSVLVEIRNTAEERVITVAVEDHLLRLFREGVYRVDAAPWRARVFAGWATLDDSTLRLTKGQMAASGDLAGFDIEQGDEFHYWTAYRSLLLEKETGRGEKWKLTDKEWGLEAHHDGFRVRTAYADGGARIHYLAASEAGVIYSMTGNARVSGPGEAENRTPLRIGENNSLFTERGRAQVFLGVGVTAYLERGARMRIVSTDPKAPVVQLDQGRLLIEVGTRDDAPTLIVQSSHVQSSDANSRDVQTVLHKRGVYTFDAAPDTTTLRVYDGEAEIRARSRVILLKAGQQAGLFAEAKVEKFDRKQSDALLSFAATRSFDLLVGQAGSLTNWKPFFRGNIAEHKVFGERADRRLRPQRSGPAPPKPPRAPEQSQASQVQPSDPSRQQ